MSKDIGEIVGRQESAPAGEKPETGDARAASETAVVQTGETPAAAATAEDPIHGLKSALGKERERADRFEKETKAEKRERAKLSQQLDIMQRQFSELQAERSKVDPKALADKFYGGPETFVTEQVGSVRDEAFKAISAKAERMSKALAKRQYEDFDEVEATFIDAAQKNPALWRGVLEDDLPAYVVYERGKQLMQQGASGTGAKSEIDELRAEIAALKAGRDGGQTEAATGTGAATAQKPSVPRSNVGTRGAGVGSTSAFRGPTPIENVYGRQKRAAAR